MVRLRRELAVGLQGKLCSADRMDSMSRKGVLPWEVSGCRQHATSVLKQHIYANQRGQVPGIVNEAMTAMGYRQRHKQAE